MRRLLLITLLAAIPSGLAAQRPGRFSPSFSGNHFSGRSGGYARAAPNGLASYYPAFLGSFYPDDASAGPDLPQPEIFRSPVPLVPPPPPAQPLLIELQGDNYVQIGQNQPSSAQVLDQPNANKNDLPHNAADLHARATVLVFRDRHRQEVIDYTITGGVLYASTDFYRSGSWTQKIDLAALNLDQTVEANRSRGVTFQLPSAPNVVIVGP